MIVPGDIETRLPFEGESLYGLVADVAGYNQLFRVAEIAGAADRTHGHRPQLATHGWDDLPVLAAVLDVDVEELRLRASPAGPAARPPGPRPQPPPHGWDDLPVLAAVLDVDVEELRLRAYPADPDDPGRRIFFGTTIARADLVTRVRRFSPAALARAPFHRAMWQLRIPFDVETGEVLVSTCPLCDRTQRWRHSAKVAFCDGCGESLQQPTEAIDELLRDDLSCAVGLTHSDPARRAASLAMLPPEVADIGPAMAYELMLRLVRVAEPACVWRSVDRIWRNDPHLIARGMAGAWRVLVGWPDAVTSRISADLSTASTRHSDGNGGATRQFLRLRSAHSLPESVRLLIERLYDSIDGAGPRGPAIGRMTMTSNEVAKLLRTGSQHVCDLRRRGVFRTVGMVRDARFVPALDREEAVGIRREIGTRLDLNRVSDRLGLPYYAVEQLAAIGRVPLLTHPFFAAWYHWPQTTGAAAADLQTSLEAGTKPELAGAESLAALMHLVGGRLKPWDGVIVAMLDGALDYLVEVGAQPLFRRVRVRRDDVMTYLLRLIARDGADSPLMPLVDPGFSFDAMMTKRDAAEVLNLSPREGTVALRSYPATSKKPTVPVADVLEMGRRHVTTAEIGRRMDVPYQSVRSAAFVAKVPRVAPAGYDRVEEGRILAALERSRHDRAR